MKAFLKALVLVPIGLAVVLLAVANRAPVTLSLDPFSQDAPAISATLPLFLILFGAVMVGVAVGGVAAWLGQGKHRRGERTSRREVERLKGDLERLRATAAPQAGRALPPA